MNERMWWKYAIFRRLPGRIGRRYAHNHTILTHIRGFANAVTRCSGMTCIDLGANVGEYTRKMAAEAGRVIAFEPDPWSLSLLRDNLSDLDNVTIEDAAAGTTDGRVSLYRHPRFHSDPGRYSEDSSVVAGNLRLTEEASYEVRQIDFIRYLDDLGDDIGVLKIDIEGSEVELLEALFDRPDILNRITYLFADTHERLFPELAARVAALRQRARRIDRTHINLDWP